MSASHNAGAVGHAIDQDPKTRYDTKAFQVPGMWFQIELPKPIEIAGLTMETAKSINDYPRGYTVELSNDGTIWSKPVATGEGTAPVTSIAIPPTKTKFIRITQTGSAKGNFWSIHELTVLEAGAVQP